MLTEFAARVRAVIDHAPFDERDRARRRVKVILRAGATSFETLLALAQDSATPLDVRLAGCWLLGQFKKKRAVSALLRAFHSEHPTLTWEAAKALAVLQSKRSAQPLAATLQQDASAHRRSAAAWTLGLPGDVRAIDALLRVLANQHENPEVRAHAAEALGHLAEGRKDERIGAHLLAGLRNRAPQVRFWSAFALGSLGDPKAIPDLERLAATDHVFVPGWWAVSEEATGATGRIRERASSI